MGGEIRVLKRIRTCLVDNRRIARRRENGGMDGDAGAIR